MSRKSYEYRKVLAGMAIAIVLVGAYILYGTAEQTETMLMEIKVENRLAFNLDPGVMRFGSVPPGNGAERSLIIQNTKPYDVRIEIYVKGDMAGWLKSFDNFFIVPSLESRNVTFIAEVPPETPLGVYNSTLLLVTKRV